MSPWGQFSMSRDTKRLPALLTSARSADRAAVAHLEESQAEPFGDYYAYAPGSMILVDSSWDIPQDVSQGELEIAVRSAGNGCFRGTVRTVRGPDKTVLAESDTAVASSDSEVVRARWVRTPDPLQAPDGQSLLELVRQRWPQIAVPRWKSINGRQTNIIAIMFPEELRKGVTGDGWVFVVQQGRKGGQVFAARTGRYSRADFGERIPALGPLARKRVALFGLGGIGGPAALEFARAGLGELRVLDHDFVDPGTTVRWPLGLGAAGQLKTSALPAFIEREYPFTTVRRWNRRIGDVVLVPSAQQTTDLDVIAEMIDGVDLIFDATAEPGIHHLLGDYAWTQGIPYITAHGTAGAAGGLVARLDPRRPTGCWVCLQKALYENKTIDEPPFDEEGHVQPLGCGDPTFTGAGFDMAEIALEAVRIATGTLCAETEGGYPSSAWDVAVLSMRTNDGTRVPPNWKIHSLPPHPDCSCTRR